MGEDLVVDDGGTAIIYGTVDRNVINRGGSITVFGTIGGRLERRAGETQVDPKASISRH